MYLKDGNIFLIPVVLQKNLQYDMLWLQAFQYHCVLQGNKPGGKNHTAVTLMFWFQLAVLLLILKEDRQREKPQYVYHSSMWMLCFVLLPWLTVLWGIQHHFFPLHYTAAPSPPWWRPLSEPAGKHMHQNINTFSLQVAK